MSNNKIDEYIKGDAQPERILLVDDMATNRAMMAAAFADSNIECVQAENGEQCLELVKQQKFSAVLLDHLMPGLTGNEVLRILRESFSALELPVIMVTALYESEIIIEALELGANDYITKPFELEVIRARVKTHLERKNAELELVRAKEIAEKATQAKSDFLAFMTHELRTPLNSVLGFTQVLEHEIEADGNNQYLEYVKYIDTSGKHLLSLVNEILDFSKVEAGKLDLNLEDCSVEELIEEMATVARSLAKENKNNLDVQYDHNIGQIHTDNIRLRQILLNLLSNAAKFTSNGSISLLVSRYIKDEKDWIRFSVADTGIGIPADEYDNLFLEFSQIGSDTHRKFGGTGLGLAITKRLSNMLGGNIDLTSTEGQGSTFTVNLPVTGPVQEKFLNA